MGYRIVIQGMGRSYNTYINLLRYYELKKEIQIIGITGLEKGITKVDGYCFIPKDKLWDIEFDYLVVASLDFWQEIFQGNIEMGIPEGKMIPINVFSLPDFRMSQYIKLKESKLTILSPHCWGGLRTIA